METPKIQDRLNGSDAGQTTTRRGKGKGRAVVRKIKSLDDGIGLQSWKEESGPSSPDAKHARRNQSEGPERDRKGNMFYKIDPKLMTDFMNNVKTTQQDIQTSLTSQKRELSVDHEKMKNEMTEWYRSLKDRLDQDRVETKQDIKQHVWEEHVSAKLQERDTTGPWRIRIDEAITTMTTQHETQSKATQQIAGQLHETIEQVKHVTENLNELRELGPAVAAIAERMANVSPVILESTPNRDDSEIKNLLTLLNGKIDGQTEKMGIMQHENTAKIDGIVKRHEISVAEIQQQITKLTNHQQELKESIPKLIQEQMAGKQDTRMEETDGLIEHLKRVPDKTEDIDGYGQKPGTDDRDLRRRLRRTSGLRGPPDSEDEREKDYEGERQESSSERDYNQNSDEESDSEDDRKKGRERRKSWTSEPDFPDFGKDMVHGDKAHFSSMQEIKTPPKFRAEAYATWVKELEMWGEFHDDHPRSALVAAIAMSATGSFKLVVETFYKDTRTRKNDRTLPNLVRRLNKNYLRRNDNLSFEIIKGWQDFERRAGESIPDFWIRWKEGMRLAKTRSKVRPLSIPRLFEPVS